MADVIKVFAQKHGLKYMYGGAYGISKYDFPQTVKQVPSLVAAIEKQVGTSYVIEGRKLLKGVDGKRIYHLVASPYDTNMDNRVFEIVVAESINDDAYVSAQLYE